MVEQCFTSPPGAKQYSLYRKRFLQVKKPNQQYQSTEGKSYKGKPSKIKTKYTHKYEIVHTKKIHI